MDRRQFLSSSVALGAGLSLTHTLAARPSAPRLVPDSLQLHPFIDAHPEAVFIRRTAVSSKLDTTAKFSEGKAFSSELFAAAENGDLPFSNALAVKPNLTCTYGTGNTADGMGIMTDLAFLDGMLGGITETGFPGTNMYAREGNWLGDGYCADEYNVTGVLVKHIADKYGMHVHDFSTGRHLRDMTVDTLQPGTEVIWRDIPDGIVSRRLGYIAPYNDDDTFLLNIAKFKTHSMGMTLCAKNLQGMVVSPYVRFCEGVDATKKHPTGILQDFQPDFEQHIDSLHAKHVAQGIPRWDREGRTATGGYGMETWAQRTCDSHSVTKTGLNIIEGIYGRNGNGFSQGPGPGDTPQDFMTNILVFGKNPFHVDIIGAWLAGHEPGNFGLFHIAHERGLSPLFNPFSIPLFDWAAGEPAPLDLADVDRTPLVCPYLTRDYNGQSEAKYHLVDEEFDYTTVGVATAPAAIARPSLNPLRNPARGAALLEVRLPKGGTVHVEVRDSAGRRVDVLRHGYMRAGVHSLRWQPSRLASGMYLFVLHSDAGIARSKVLFLR